MWHTGILDKIRQHFVNFTPGSFQLVDQAVLIQKINAQLSTTTPTEQLAWTGQ